MKIFLILLMGIFFVTSCASVPLDESNPQSIYDHALENSQSSRYQLAIDQFNMIKHKFPYSPLAIEAQWQIADLYFIQEQYLESAATFEIFFDLYPNHLKAPYALFKIAECYDKSAPKVVERDLTNVEKARMAYQKFIVYYQKQEAHALKRTEAAERIQSLTETLAEKEWLIGNFYYHRDFFTSAKMRYEKVLALYGATKVAQKAKEKLRIIVQNNLETHEPEHKFH